MSSPKFGHCPLCPKGSPEKRLYGGLCAHHIGHPQDDQSRQRLIKDPVQDNEEKLLRKFFQEQARLMPRYCENLCGTRLPVPGRADDWLVKASICHILPKRTFKSVIVHPLNRWFGCGDCHTNFDNLGWTYAVTMKVWPVIVERFQQFFPMLLEIERVKLPDVFRQYIDIPL